MLKTILSILICCFTVTSVYGQLTANQTTDTLQGKWVYSTCTGGFAGGGYSCQPPNLPVVTFQKIDSLHMAVRVFKNGGVLVNQDILTLQPTNPWRLPTTPIDVVFGRLVFQTGLPSTYYNLQINSPTEIEFVEPGADVYQYHYIKDTNYQFNNSCFNSLTFTSNADTCNSSLGSATPIGGTAAYTYFWSNGETSANITGLSAGTYTVTVIDDNFCVEIDSVEIFNTINFDSLTFTSNADTCNGLLGRASVTPIGGNAPYTYSWSNGWTSANIFGLSAGTYTVTVIDDYFCVAIDSVEIFNTTNFDSLTFTSNADTCNGLLGSAKVTPIGGTAPYTYSWSNGDTSANITGLSAGTYSVTVVDYNFCAVVDLVTINLTISPLSTIIDLVNDRYITCGQSCLNLTSNTPNGSGPYNYIWSTGANSKNISVCPTATTNYYLTVTDSTGCILSDTATVVVSDTICGAGRVSICKTLRNRQFTYCIDTAQLAYNLSQGATLGCCSNAPPLQQGPGGTGGIFSKVYPNPFTLKTTIEFSSPHTGMVTVEIFNTLGQTVFQSQVNQQQFVIDMLGIGGKGAYILHVYDSNNVLVERKHIILQ